MHLMANDRRAWLLSVALASNTVGMWNLAWLFRSSAEHIAMALQLRNLLWATSKHDVYVVLENRVNHWSALSRETTTASLAEPWAALLPSVTCSVLSVKPPLPASLQATCFATEPSHLDPAIHPFVNHTAVAHLQCSSVRRTRDGKSLTALHPATRSCKAAHLFFRPLLIYYVAPRAYDSLAHDCTPDERYVRGSSPFFR